MDSPRVIVIDDDQLAIKAIELWFSKEGIEVDTFNSPLKALDLIKAKSYQYCMAIVDFQMKELAGNLVIKEIKQINSKILTLALSGDESEEAYKLCLEAGADNFYSKSNNVDNILSLYDVARSKHKKSIPRKNREKINKELIETVLNLKGASDSLADVAKFVKRFSLSNDNVLIQGPSGTGKERIAMSIHRNSTRSGNNFVPINCSAIPDKLSESILFGHVKGAFTGADRDSEGKFVLANHGTIFLDEIGDMPSELQAKLLRVLQEREVYPVGSKKCIKLNVKVVAATNKNLFEEVKNGNFREDLYYRLNTLPIDIEPLSQRIDDISPIAKHIIDEKNKEMDLYKHLSVSAIKVLKEHVWQGNVRELEGVLKKVYMLEYDNKNTEISENAVKRALSSSDREMLNTALSWKQLEEEQKDFQRTVLENALKAAKGSKKDAAKLLNMPLSSYRTKRVALGLEKKEKIVDSTL